MKVWGTILIFVVCITAFILLLSAFFALSVAFFARRNSEKTLNKNLKALEKMLPGKDCGECGCATCAEYANAVFTLRKDADCCTQGGEELPGKLEALMDQFNKSLEDDTPKEEDRQYC